MIQTKGILVLSSCKAAGRITIGKPYAGKLHVRFDEGSLRR